MRGRARPRQPQGSLSPTAALAGTNLRDSNLLALHLPHSDMLRKSPESSNVALIVFELASAGSAYTIHEAQKLSPSRTGWQELWQSADTGTFASVASRPARQLQHFMSMLGIKLPFYASVSHEFLAPAVRTQLSTKG